MRDWNLDLDLDGEQYTQQKPDDTFKRVLEEIETAEAIFTDINGETYNVTVERCCGDSGDCACDRT